MRPGGVLRAFATPRRSDIIENERKTTEHDVRPGGVLRAFAIPRSSDIIGDRRSLARRFVMLEHGGFGGLPGVRPAALAYTRAGAEHSHPLERS